MKNNIYQSRKKSWEKGVWLMMYVLTFWLSVDLELANAETITSTTKENAVSQHAFQFF